MRVAYLGSESYGILLTFNLIMSSFLSNNFVFLSHNFELAPFFTGGNGLLQKSLTVMSLDVGF